MVQFRRLDPLANASAYQKLLKSPVKSFSITESQYNRVEERREPLIVTFYESAVVSVPYADTLLVNYAYPDVAAFRENFSAMFDASVGASSKEEAPRGLVLSFRDRPNRALAETLFWGIALDQGEEWVEMNWIAVPEQPEPDANLGEGFSVREAADEDSDAIADVEAAASGQERLTPNGVASIREHARWLRVVTDSNGAVVGFLAMHSEPGGWGVIDYLSLKPEVAEALTEPLLRWAIAFLRNNGGRRIRRRVYTSKTADVTLLRNIGFTPGEAGIDYVRAVDPSEVKSKIEERQAHGSLIKFGDWR